jgi:hypothetical protein
MKSDWNKLRRQAEQQGWRVVPTTKGHLKWYAPDKATIVVSGTSTSDWRGFNNQLAHMRKAGFKA